MRIEDIDKNLKVETVLGRDDLVFADVRSEPFRVYGLYDYKNQSVFRRLPEEVARATNPGVYDLHTNTAGGRVRFSTDSPYIAIRCRMPRITRMSHMAFTGIAGFDLYEHQHGLDLYRQTFIPPFDMTEGYSSMHLVSEDGAMHNYTIHFPLYNDVESLEIGLVSGSRLEAGPAYADIKPIVYYGSSITQGGCASRPGNAYQNIISARRNYDHINLGFSGSAWAEDVIAEYIAGLEMSVFVCDYDHNAPDQHHLEKTHERLYRTVRDKHPNLPILFISKADYLAHETTIWRRDVIFNTYRKAYDENRRVGYIDGYAMYGVSWRDACTVDGTHPNDAGFLRMADVIGPEIERLLRMA